MSTRYFKTPETWILPAQVPCVVAFEAQPFLYGQQLQERSQMKVTTILYVAQLIHAQKCDQNKWLLLNTKLLSGTVCYTAVDLCKGPKISTGKS